MKRIALKRKSKSETRKIQDKIWKLLREKAINKWGSTCYTCGKTNLVGSNRHLGHMWPKAAVGANLKYDLRILRIQCFHCNINLGGNGAVFYAKMLQEIGEEEMKKLEQERNVIVKASDHYIKLLRELEEELRSDENKNQDS